MKIRSWWTGNAEESRGAAGLVPALAGRLGASARPVPYVRGRSRFVVSPLTLTLDQLLFLIVAGLLCFGLIMVQSADLRVRGVTEHWILQSFNNKNAVHAAAALVVMTIAWRIDYTRLQGRKLLTSPAMWFLIFTVVTLVAVLAVGSTLNGAKRWLMIPLGVTKLSVQPSEFAKWAMVIFIAAYAAHCQDSIRTIGRAMFPIGLVLVGMACFAGIILLTPEVIVKLEPLAKFVAKHGIGRLQMWLGVGGVATLGTALLMCRRESFRRWEWGFLPLITVMAVVCALVVKEDFGTTALIALVAFCLIAMAGTRSWHLASVIPPAMAVVYVAVWHSAYRRERLLAFLNPEADPQGNGYHALQSLLTIASGGFWGKGLGNGIQKMGYLPEGNTDFVFAVLCEELGFIGAGMVIALFVLFVLIGWRVASRCQNLFGKLVAFGITATVGLQAAINIAVVTVTVPTKGIALPFISSGGTGWILTAGAVGLLMGIERQNRLATAAVEVDAIGSQGFLVEMDGEVETSADERRGLLAPVEVAAKIAPAQDVLRPVPVVATAVEPVAAEPVASDIAVTAVEASPVATLVTASPVDVPVVEATPVEAVHAAAVVVAESPTEEAHAVPVTAVTTKKKSDYLPLLDGPVIMVASLPTVATPSPAPVPAVTRWPKPVATPEVAGETPVEPKMDADGATHPAPGEPSTGNNA